MRHNGLFKFWLGAAIVQSLFGQYVLADGLRAGFGEPNAYVDDLLFNATLYDIGQETAYTVGPALPPTAAINGPITNGRVRGQFEFTCSDPGGNGTFGPEDCPDAAYAAANFNWKWGVLQAPSNMTLTNSAFMEVAGSNFFPSDLANDGFTFVTDGLPNNTNPATRLAHFEFNLQSVPGLVLPAGFDYIIFGMLAPENVILPNRVPGEGVGFGGNAEETIFLTATDDQPRQLHLAFPTLFPTPPGVDINMIVTSRIIPVVPEPGSLLLVAMGIGAIAIRRNKRPI